LGSLVRFLQVPVLHEPTQFRRHITNKVQPVKFCGSSDFEPLRSLLGSICLRRNKTVLPMSVSSEYIYKLDFTSEEKLEYDRLSDACLSALNAAMCGHQSEKSHQTVIQAILRLRLFCNNGLLDRNRYNGVLGDPDMAFSLLQQAGDTVCQYCSCDIQSVHESSESGKTSVRARMKLTCKDCAAMNGEQSLASNALPSRESQHGDVLDIPDGLHHLSSVVRERYPSKLVNLCDDIQKHQQQSKRYTSCMCLCPRS
jgi:SWI/SNF-related matrix-associated actin-dependent regulator of chromatin subfamily A3